MTEDDITTPSEQLIANLKINNVLLMQISRNIEYLTLISILNTIESVKEQDIVNMMGDIIREQREINELHKELMSHHIQVAFNELEKGVVTKMLQDIAKDHKVIVERMVQH